MLESAGSRESFARARRCDSTRPSFPPHAGCFIRRIRNVSPLSLRQRALTIGLGGFFLPIIWLRSSRSVNFGSYIVFFAGYGGTLFFGGSSPRRRLLLYGEREDPFLTHKAKSPSFSKPNKCAPIFEGTAENREVMKKSVSGNSGFELLKNKKRVLGRKYWYR